MEKLECDNGDDPQSTSTEAGYTTEVDDIPPWYITLLGCLQLLVGNISAMITAGYIIHSSVCPGDNQLLYAELVSTAIFMSGACTLLQCIAGARIPIIQGSSYAFFPVVNAMMITPKWRCPETNFNSTGFLLNITYGDNMTSQLTSQSIINASSIDTEAWRPRILEISGSLAAASCLQVFLGCTGIIGVMMNYIGPITIIPVISLIGLTLLDVCIPGAKTSWSVTALVVCLMILFSLFLDNVQVPFPAYTKKSGWTLSRYPFFRYFPHLLSLCIGWLVCHILTVTDVFSPDPSHVAYNARTDSKLEVMTKATWFFIPYPGRLGTPTFGLGTFVGMTAAIIASILESIGDYYATADVCGMPPPPKHAVNRGIIMEGLGSILSGLVGACHATTSYSNTIALIQISGLKSRIIWIAFGVLMILFGICGKIGAALSLIPEPVIAGSFVVGLGVIIGIGMSGIQHIALTTRNLVIVGVSILLGMMIPTAIKEDPNMIQTGNLEADQVISVVLSTGLFVGGVMAFIMDNIIPGTREERGMLTFLAIPTKSDDNSATDDVTSDKSHVYDLPWLSAKFKQSAFCRRIPFLPGYGSKQSQYNRDISIISNGEDSMKLAIESPDEQIIVHLGENDLEDSTDQTKTQLLNVNNNTN